MVHKHKLKSVAVYCGHEFGSDPQFARDAAKIGAAMARNKVRIVFGGGDVGLMGTVATSALDNGGVVVGISTHDVVAKQEPVHTGINVEIVDGVNARKQKMYELADAFIILPGGIGTLNEFTDIMTMQQIGETAKPIFFMNTSKFWDSFGALFVHMQQNGFIENADDYEIYSAVSPDDLIKKILEY